MREPARTQPVVVVTGAAGRLGRLMARGFADQKAHVAAIVRNRAASDIPGRLFPANLADEADTARVFANIQAAFGPVDVLVHTVGGWAETPLMETSLEEWDRLLRINLTTTFLCFREAARHMPLHGGRLIAFASGQGADRGRARQSAYAAAKAGVVRVVESLAEELAPAGITTHAIAPSYVLFEDHGAARGVHAASLVDLALYVAGPAGASLNGATLRAYGTLS